MILLEVLDILGHTITSQGLSAESSKVLDVKFFPIPNNRKKLSGFMGMVNYLSIYAPHLATAAALLTHLCGNTIKWQLVPIHNTSLQQVKNITRGEAI